MDRDSKDPMITVSPGKARLPSPHEIAMYEAGKKLLDDSVSTGVDFCKSMLSTSTAAIAVYYALFTYVLADDYEPTISQRLVILLPPLLFLAAAGVFAWGYLPSKRSMNLNTVRRDPANPSGQSIEEAHSAILEHRATGSRWGMILFLGALIVASVVVTGIAMGHQTDALPDNQNAVIVLKSGEVRCGELVAGSEPGSLAIVQSGISVSGVEVPIIEVASLETVDACP